MPATLQGYLRDSVALVPSEHGLELRFSVWGIDLPQQLLSNNPGLCAFLRREAGADQAATESEPVQKLLHLLKHQGCLVPTQAKSHYTLGEVREFFVSFCNAAYGRYYAHGVWDSLRGEAIALPLLRQWTARTYFLSRFAGVTASAACRHAPTLAVRQAFLKSAVEEYSHCEDFYQPPTCLFPGELGYTHGIAPAASFLAFDQQMLRIARHDWLAHLFVALFQERTAQFRDSADRLYLRVERQLQQPNLFAGWRKHIAFDEANSHAGDLDTLFDQDILVPREVLERSFDEAGLTIDLLIKGLDEVLELGSTDHNPRAICPSLMLQGHHVQGLRTLSDRMRHAIRARGSVELTTEWVRLVGGTDEGTRLLADIATPVLNRLLHGLVSLTTKCLEHADTHAQILGLGRVLQAALESGMTLEPQTASTERVQRVLENHMARCARVPDTLVFVALLLLRMAETGQHLREAPADPGPWPAITLALEQAVPSLCPPETLETRVQEAVNTLAMLEFVQQLMRHDEPVSRFALAHGASAQTA